MKKEQLIVNYIYLFNKHKTNKDNTRYYKFVEYKVIYKCPTFIKSNDKDEIVKFDNKYNHNDHENKTYYEKVRKKLQTQIKNSIEPFVIKIPKLYKSYSSDRGIKSLSFNNY